MKDKRKTVCLVIGLILGALADICLRLTTGDEGNLLIHSVVFLDGAFLAAGAAYALSSLWLRLSNRK